MQYISMSDAYTGSYQEGNEGGKQQAELTPF